MRASQITAILNLGGLISGALTGYYTSKGMNMCDLVGTKIGEGQNPEKIETLVRGLLLTLPTISTAYVAISTTDEIAQDVRQLKNRLGITEKSLTERLPENISIPLNESLVTILATMTGYGLGYVAGKYY